MERIAVMNNVLEKLILVLVLFGATALGHDRKDVDDISVLFGGEPEPMVNDERQFLRWKFTDVDTKEVITDLEALEAVVTFAGKEAGTFTARGPRREPGVYKTSHIFAVPGEGEVTLSFKREGNDKVYTVTFTFSVISRHELTIPR
jgi:hypothetical protein